MSISKELISVIRSRYQLNWHGIHGVAHWARVRDIGLKLAEKTGANPKVVELFAFLHDSCRLDDGHDEEHGMRSARFAESLRGEVIHLADEEFESLHSDEALASNALISEFQTVTVSWVTVAILQIAVISRCSRFSNLRAAGICS